MYQIQSGLKKYFLVIFIFILFWCNGITFSVIIVKAIVTPIIKKASLPNEDLQNYQPVSGLCFMSKLVERVVVKQLMQHINIKNLDNL